MRKVALVVLIVAAIVLTIYEGCRPATEHPPAPADSTSGGVIGDPF